MLVSDYIVSWNPRRTEALLVSTVRPAFDEGQVNIPCQSSKAHGDRTEDIYSAAGYRTGINLGLTDNTSNIEVLILETSLYTLVGICKRYAVTKWIHFKAFKP